MEIKIENLTDQQKRLLEQMTRFFCDPAHAAALANFLAGQGALVADDGSALNYVRFTPRAQARLAEIVNGKKPEGAPCLN